MSAARAMRAKGRYDFFLLHPTVDGVGRASGQFGDYHLRLPIGDKGKGLDGGEWAAHQNMRTVSFVVGCVSGTVYSFFKKPSTHTCLEARLLSMCPDFPTGQFDAVGKKVGFFTGWQVFSYPYKNYAAHTATHKWVRSRSFRCRAVFDVLCLTASKNLDTAAPAAAAA